MVIAFQNEGDFTCVVGDASLQKAQRRGIRITASFDSQLEMVARVIRRGIGGKTACRAMLKALVYRQNHHFPRATQTAMVEHTSQVRANTRVFAGIPA